MLSILNLLLGVWIEFGANSEDCRQVSREQREKYSTIQFASYFQMQIFEDLHILICESRFENLAIH